MSDEEKRIFEEQRKNNKNENQEIKAEEPKQEKIAEILDVKLLDKDGNEKNVFETGELVNVEITCELDREIKNPIFGIIIRNDTKNDVFALNTMYKKINTGLVKEGARKITFSIKNYFSSGTYFISPAIANQDQSIIDWKDNFKSFRIINKEFTSFAIADFDTDIIIK